MDLLEHAKYLIEQSSRSSTAIFLVVVVIFFLALGIPPILKGNFKGFLVGISALVLAAFGTYFLLFS